MKFTTIISLMTPEQRKAYQEYLADFDPTPQYGGEDYDYPMSEDAWLEQRQDEAFNKLVEKNSAALTALAVTGREGALNALDRLYEENSEGLRRLAQEDNS